MARSSRGLNRGSVLTWGTSEVAFKFGVACVSLCIFGLANLVYFGKALNRSFGLTYCGGSASFDPTASLLCHHLRCDSNILEG